MAGKKSERDAIDDVVKRLQDKYPQMTDERVAEVVETTYESFQHAKLRDYIAVLVEHGAKATLKQEKRSGA